MKERVPAFKEAQGEEALLADFWPSLMGQFFAIWPDQDVENADWDNLEAEIGEVDSGAVDSGASGPKEADSGSGKPGKQTRKKKKNSSSAARIRHAQ